MTKGDGLFSGFWFVVLAIIFLSFVGVVQSASASTVSLPGVQIDLTSDSTEPEEVSKALQILFGITVLSLAPAILIVMSSFTRIVIVLSMLRHALGMQQTPPNTVLISLALFLTFFSMLPVINSIKVEAYEPYLAKELSAKQAIDESLVHARSFMIRQTREKDLALMVETSGTEQPETVDDIDTFLLIPAFMLSELQSAFQIGFMIFLPFVLIDIIVASILMSMGMLMVPPMMISLPIKVLMFILIDGWALVVHSLMNSFV